MFRRLLLSLVLCLIAVPAIAQDVPNPTRTVRLQQPPNIPDLPTYGNIGKYVAIMEFVGNPHSPAFTITFLTTDDTTVVMAWYADMLRQAGWNKTTRDAAQVLSARRKNAMVVITATKSPDKKFRSSVYINYRIFGSSR